MSKRSTTISHRVVASLCRVLYLSSSDRIIAIYSWRRVKALKPESFSSIVLTAENIRFSKQSADQIIQNIRELPEGEVVMIIWRRFCQRP